MSSKSIDVELSEDTVQINVINNESAYNLLSSVIYKRQLNRRKEMEKKIRKDSNLRETIEDIIKNIRDR